MNLLLASSGLGALPGVLAAAATELRLGFIAAAGEPFPDPHWIVRDRVALVALGFYVIDIPLQHRVDSLNDYDVIFVAGGNTYFLLQQMRSSGFDETLGKFLSDGKLYVGSGAGSIVVSADIEITAEPSQRRVATTLASTRGLSLVPFYVLPHAGSSDNRFIDAHSTVLTAHPDVPIVRITDNEALHVTDSGTRVLWSPPLE